MNPGMIWAVAVVLAKGGMVQRDGCIPNPPMRTWEMISQVGQDKSKMAYTSIRREGFVPYGCRTLT